MGAEDLVFTRVSDAETIYDPQTVDAAGVQIRVTNFGDDNLSGIGLYIVPATNVGDVDNPADYPPQTDYQDLLTWGTESALGIEAQGGIKLTVPQNDAGAFNGYVTRTQGASYANKIEFIDLAAGDSAVFTVEFETPPGVAARRFFVDLKLE